MASVPLKWSIKASVGVYRVVLYVYPPRFRAAYGREMAQVFRGSCREAVARRGPPGLLPLWGATLRDLAVTAAQEWGDALGIARHRRLRMRPRASYPGRYGMMRRRRHGPFGELYRALKRMRSGFMSRPAMRTLPESITLGPGITEADRRRTRPTERALIFARDEAEWHHHTHVGTEHLLLGLLREREGVAAKVLYVLGVDTEAVRRDVEFIIGRGEREVVGEAIGLTRRARRVLELAGDEMRAMNARYIGTEHLLLGMLREGEGIAAGALNRAGVHLDAVRAEVPRASGEMGA
ncbi:MAG: ATP-dependent Clp protease, ATP-binding subunit ClpC [Ktedonobacterales bacterium]|nr:MAG: ATP-dependent Clp protease, ATP-binding subunit ClpC [Ktedonobacterales bacterium]